MNTRPASRILRLAAALLLAGACCQLGGCETTEIFASDPQQATPREGEWTTIAPITAPSVDIIWERVRLVLAAEGYRPDAKLTNFGTKVIVTDWQTQLAPNRFEGIRRRVHVEILPAEAQKSWTVRVAVIKQRNADIDQPMNPVLAEWELSENDPTRSALIAWKIGHSFETEK